MSEPIIKINCQNKISEEVLISFDIELIISISDSDIDKSPLKSPKLFFCNIKCIIS